MLQPVIRVAGVRWEEGWQIINAPPFTYAADVLVHSVRTPGGCAKCRASPCEPTSVQSDEASETQSSPPRRAWEGSLDSGVGNRKRASHLPPAF